MKKSEEQNKIHINEINKFKLNLLPRNIDISSYKNFREILKKLKIPLLLKILKY